MLPTEHARGEALLTLARTHFDPNLRPIEEQALRHSCAYEDPADWTPDPYSPDPTRHETTGRPILGSQLPAIRPALLRWLLTTPDATALLEPRGLRIWNARLTEPLDLGECSARVRLEFRYCLLEQEIILTSAELSSIYLISTTLARFLEASRIELQGPLYCKDVWANGTIKLDQAQIEAELYMENTCIACEGRALSLSNAHIKNDVQLSPFFRSRGHLYFDHIDIGGSLVLIEADMKSIRFVDSKIAGQVNLNGCRLRSTEDALVLDQARIGGAVLLRPALLGEGGEFSSRGRISMRGADIGGSVEFDKAKLTSPAINISMDNGHVRGAIFLRAQCQCSGTVTLNGAQIGRQIDCTDGLFTRLLFEASIVRSHVLLRNCVCTDEVRLLNAQIGGQLSCDGASIQYLMGENMHVAGDFFWRDIQNSEQTKLHLVGAKISVLRDDKKSWPSRGNLEIDGLNVLDFSVDRSSSSHALNRMAWLNLQSEGDLAKPQPWLFLAAHFEAKGDKRAAKRVIYELRKHQSRANWKNSRVRHLGYLWDVTFASLGEEPLRMVMPLALLVLFGGTVFYHYRAHFAPTSEAAYRVSYRPDGKHLELAPFYPKFEPFAYTLENVLPAVKDILPVIKIGQDERWAPDAGRTTPVLYKVLISIRWFLIVSGYVMGAIVAAAIGARFRG